MLLCIYRALSTLITPLLCVYLKRRQSRGKEHPTRLSERWGHAALPRPHGTLVWVHAASVGESQSALPLISALLEKHPNIHLLLTTGTVSSAEFIAPKLPPRAFHQFVPVDTSAAASRFIAHWQPELAIWMESELWPNLLSATHKNGAKMALVNARMSEKSFHSWQRFPKTIQTLLSKFDLIAAQAPQDAARLEALGAPQVQMFGNLKQDASDLPFEEATLQELQSSVAGRPLWLAASTHSGEETLIAEAHRQLAKKHIGLLTIIVPRHPPRGEKIYDELAASDLQVSLRSRGDTIFKNTEIYLADTIGELGLFYRLANIVFMGGSLIPHGGQNPLEAARLDCALLAGTHTHNFEDIYAALERHDALLRASDAASLAAGVDSLLTDKALQGNLSHVARNHVQSQQGALTATLDALSPFLDKRLIAKRIRP